VQARCCGAHGQRGDGAGKEGGLMYQPTAYACKRCGVNTLAGRCVLGDWYCDDTDACHDRAGTEPMTIERVMAPVYARQAPKASTRKAA
jgi:hypothetical protein